MRQLKQAALFAALIVSLSFGLAAARAQVTLGAGVTIGGTASQPVLICTSGSSETQIPFFSPTGGTYTAAQTVSMTCPTPSADIFYTTDGSTPTIDSAQYLSPLTVSTTTTLSALAAVVPVYDTEINHTLNYGSSPGDWKTVCILPGCNPGGSGTPTSTSQTINNSTPSLSGNSMLISLTADANSTNALWTHLDTACDSCTTMVSDFYFYIPSGNPTGNREFDAGWFDTTHQLENMFGSQCNPTAGYWQIANDTSAWTSTPVACSLTQGAWHHVQWFYHRILGDTGCGGLGCNYYDTLIVDGVSHAIGMTEPAQTLPSGYADVTFTQFQMDIATASSSSPVTMSEYLDNVKLMASTPPSAVNSATYTIQ
jgi:hypothetical protein